MSRIAFVTSAPWRTLVPDDLLAAAALERLGHEVVAAVWDDAAVDWTRFDAVMLRSCWDYPEAAGAFLEWIARLEAAAVPLHNPPDTVRWNLDKRYLAELASAGVPVVPTEYAAGGESLADLLARRGWDRAVVKPRVSADGQRTRLVHAAGAAREQPALDALAGAGGALVQPFLPEVVERGELSFVFLGGEYSHAVLKRAAAGEFRVQPRLGGRAAAAEPEAALIGQAARALAAVPHDWSYARVDGCVRDGVLIVMELELIEPTLFFEERPGSAESFAALVARLAARRG